MMTEGESKGNENDGEEDEDEVEAEAVRAQKEQEAAADKASEKKNLQYRALSEIGLSEQQLKGFDNRLAEIHNLPAGFTASEMSFAIADDVFAEVLYCWHNRYRETENSTTGFRTPASPESTASIAPELKAEIDPDEEVTSLDQNQDNITEPIVGRMTRAASIAYAHTTVRKDGTAHKDEAEPSPEAATKTMDKTIDKEQNEFVAACFTMDEMMFGCSS